LHSEFEKHFGAAQVRILLQSETAKRISGTDPEQLLKSAIVNGSSG
jgi:hypothetical protein